MQTHVRLSAERETELAHIAQEYGEPRRIAVTFDHIDFDPLNKTDRIGEVCMVIRRREGCLITARKTYYPPNAHRLLTGGIAADEPIIDALLRETYEETSLDVEIRQFLAVISYQAANRTNANNKFHAFTTFAFLLDEVGGVLASQDENERIAEFCCIATHELAARAAFLENLSEEYTPEIRGRWSDWGAFRAVVHRIVSKKLQGIT